jgi:hypothetical protein
MKHVKSEASKKRLMAWLARITTQVDAHLELEDSGGSLSDNLEQNLQLGR